MYFFPPEKRREAFGEASKLDFPSPSPFLFFPSPYIERRLADRSGAQCLLLSLSPLFALSQLKERPISEVSILSSFSLFLFPPPLSFLSLPLYTSLPFQFEERERIEVVEGRKRTPLPFFPPPLLPSPLFSFLLFSNVLRVRV